MRASGRRSFRTGRSRARRCSAAWRSGTTDAGTWSPRRTASWSEPDSPAARALRVEVERFGQRLTPAVDASAEHARSLGATSVSGSLSEEELPWAERRGFEAFDREVEFVLELRGVVEWPDMPAGIAIGELREHELEDAHRVYADGVADIPSPEPLETSFEKWWTKAQAAPLVLVAREAGRIVGYAELGRQSDDALGHELTAVARTHRRRGIGRALKQTQMAWAVEHGYRRLTTDTHWANVATRRLNESCGYRA